MKSFLEHTVEYLLEKHGTQLSGMWVIFPNRRARLYFNRYLSQKIDKPFMAPRFFTSNELMQELSGLTPADNFYLLIELFKTYREVTKSKQTFDEFYFYTETILADFDDIDKYLVNASDLYQNLSALKSIDAYFEYLSKEQIEYIRLFWESFNASDPSEEQTGFITFWESLSKVYTLFNQRLDDLKMAYEGKIYREVIHKYDEIEGRMKDVDKLIFVGFNALNKCEDRLFSLLHTADKAEFYWDYDSYYIDSTFHDAGYFLREYLRKFPSPPDFRAAEENNLSETKITSVSVPSHVGQAKIIPDALKLIAGDLKNIHEDTAIILTDESLLFPVLYSVPDEIQDLNISMGYPVKHSSILSFIKSFIELHTQSKKTSGSRVYYYYLQVIEILSLPYISVSNRDQIEEFINVIRDHNRVYIKGDELEELSALCRLLFEKTEKPEDLMEKLLEVLKFIMDLNLKKDSSDHILNVVEQEILFKIYTQILRLGDLLEKMDFDISLSVMVRVVYKMLSGVTVPFSGEPLQGLQIMGILETRVIDFKHLVILSMNEGTFPKTGNVPSFIPYNLRKGFQLPTLEHQDSIFSYYFYRLLHKAENCYLMYNSSDSDVFSNEKSRFITQLELDPYFQVRRINYSFTLTALTPIGIEIPKDEETIIKLSTYFSTDNNSFLSPSAIQNYIGCPLKFYFKYVRGLKPADEVDEEIASNIFGSIMHKAMCLLYKPFEGSVIHKDTLQELIRKDTRLEGAINQALEEEYYKSEKENRHPEEGRIMLMKEVIKKYIQGIISNDIKSAPIEIIHLEKKHILSAGINIDGKQQEINLGGIIDRIDRVNDTIRVIDYKTGQIKLSTPDIGALFDQFQSPNNSPVFQVLAYCMLLKQKYPESQIQPGLFFIRDIFSNKFNSQIIINKKKIAGYNEVYSLYEEHLYAVIEKIFSRDIPFKQTDNHELCKFCDFRLICHR